MGLTELIQILGDDNITFQNLANSCSGGTTNKKGEVTYKLITEPKNDIASVLMNRSITCFVLWLDTAKVKAAMAQGDVPKPRNLDANAIVHDKNIYQYGEAVFVVFDPTDDGSSILGACRTLEEAKALLNKAATGEGAANGFM